MGSKAMTVRTSILSEDLACEPVRTRLLQRGMSILTRSTLSGNPTPIDPQEARFIGLPANPDPSKVGPIGNLGRNTERSPGLKNWDLNIVKRFRITESIALQFRGEFYNVFNTPQYGTVSVSPFHPAQNAQSIPANVNTLAARCVRQRLLRRWRRPRDSLAVAFGVLASFAVVFYSRESVCSGYSCAGTCPYRRS